MLLLLPKHIPSFMFGTQFVAVAADGRTLAAAFAWSSVSSNSVLKVDPIVLARSSL